MITIMITIKTSYQKSLSKPPKYLIPILAYENAGNWGKAMSKMKKNTELLVYGPKVVNKSEYNDDDKVIKKFS